MTITDKVGILADAAKYDASCSTSGSMRRNPGGIGSCELGGICHAWSADGRCISLLKVLLSNVCAYDCAYCVNRRSNDVRRASFEPAELAGLIMEYYRRNYIEGAFLSSAVTGCPDATMERLVHVARLLRERERFNGYLHIKIIPGASGRLILEAARLADRASVNIELPSSASLALIAPDKKPAGILGPMGILARASGFEPRAVPSLPGPDAGIAAEGLAAPGRASRSNTAAPEIPARPDPAAPASIAVPPGAPVHVLSSAQGRAPYERAPDVTQARRLRPRDPAASLIPAGQTTQLVVGASPETDATILSLAENLYLAFDVRRVYYSAFVPTGGDPRLPAPRPPPLAREHRLYQADWLFRFYGFRANEILDPSSPFLDLKIDPKCGWALRNPGLFPVEVNTADYLELLRVPGIGPTSAARIVKARRHGALRPESLAPMGVVMKRARWFITAGGKPAASGWSALDHPELLRRMLLDPLPVHGPSSQLEFRWENEDE